MRKEFYDFCALHFDKIRNFVLKIDFSLICGIGGAGVVVNLKNGNVAKIGKMEITKDQKVAEKMAGKMEFLSIKQAVEKMEGNNLWKQKYDASFILQPENTFIQKIGKNWFSILGKT